MIPRFHFRAHIQKNRRQDLEETPAHPCPQQPYSQQLRGGSSPLPTVG